ncbi:MAG: hypothetical protein ACOY94_00375 [Bacillota bacterium]
MKARRWVWLSVLVLIIAVLTAGCQSGKRSKGPDGDFTPLTLDAAPAELQGYYDETKAIPGLFVLQKKGQAYLLVMAGTAPEADMRVEIVDIRKVGQKWRVLATLEAGGSGDYPYAVVQVEAPPGVDFSGRLTGPDGEVRELRAIVISDR